MNQPFREFYKLPIPCPDCRNSTHETVAWLVDHDEITCSFCGIVIDLTLKETRAFIEDADRLCSKIWGPVEMKR